MEKPNWIKMIVMSNNWEIIKYFIKIKIKFKFKKINKKFNSNKLSFIKYLIMINLNQKIQINQELPMQ